MNKFKFLKLSVTENAFQEFGWVFELIKRGSNKVRQKTRYNNLIAANVEEVYNNY